MMAFATDSAVAFLRPARLEYRQASPVSSDCSTMNAQTPWTYTKTLRTYTKTRTSLARQIATRAAHALSQHGRALFLLAVVPAANWPPQTSLRRSHAAHSNFLAGHLCTFKTGTLHPEKRAHLCTRHTCAQTKTESARDRRAAAQSKLSRPARARMLRGCASVGELIPAACRADESGASRAPTSVRPARVRGHGVFVDVVADRLVLGQACCLWVAAARAGAPAARFP
jgi:hypothetical protein